MGDYGRNSHAHDNSMIFVKITLNNWIESNGKKTSNFDTKPLFRSIVLDL